MKLNKNLKSIFLVSLISLLLFSCADDEVILDDETILNQCLKIGDMHEGGIIFYIDSSNEHGLIAAPMDQSEGAPWGCEEATERIAFKRDIGFGNENTNAILAGCTNENIAARICADLELNGYDDWFLPTTNELRLVEYYKNTIGGFTQDETGIYSTSNEINGTSSNGNTVRIYAVYFGINPLTPDRGVGIEKDTPLRVRAIRKF